MPRFLIFGVVIVTLLVQAMGGSAVAVAFPDISVSFNVSLVVAGWVLSVYALATVITLPLSGNASDALGRKRTFVFFVLLFTAGSFLCAIAPNIYWLILFRLIQGAGSGGFMTSASGIIADAFPNSRQRSLGLLTSVVGVGAVLGPVLGGWLTESFGWRSVFWFTIPMSVTALIAGAVLLKPDAPMGHAGLDFKGAGLFSASLGAFMVGLTAVGNQASGTSWAVAAALAIAGLVLAAAFLRHERRVKAPMIDPEMLEGRPFAAANAFNTAYGVILGVFSFLPLYAVTVYGASAIQSGLIMVPRALGLIGGSVVSSFLLCRLGYRRPMIVGVLMLAVACFVFGFRLPSIGLAGITVSGMVLLLVAVAVSGLGHGISSPAANNACMELRPELISTITGVRNTFRNAGQALGIAVASIILGSFGSLDRGFVFVFFGFALVGLMSIPFTFAMPRSPADVPLQRTDKARAP